MWARALACDVASVVPDAAARSAVEAGAAAALLARFFGDGDGDDATTGAAAASSAFARKRAPEGAIAAARAAAALSIPASRGGRLAAALASPPPPREGCRVASAAEGRSAPSRSVVASVSSRAGSGSSLDAALADALAPLWCDGNPAVDARLREALDADRRADDAAAAAARRRRRGRGGGGGSIAIASGSAMTLPLVLLAHPSANVRSAAADAFASRVAAAPDRAPAALPRFSFARAP